MSSLKKKITRRRIYPDDGDKDDVNSRRKTKRRKKMVQEMTNDEYIQIRLLRGILDNYQQNKLYPHDNPNSLQDFLKNWLQDHFPYGNFRILIEKLKKEFWSEENMVLDNVYNQIKILAAMIEYYINEGKYPFPNPKHYEDFYTKMLRFMKLSLGECWLAIHRAKRTYENLVGKKGIALVFWSIDDLLMFNLSKIIWGSEGQRSQVEIDMKFLSTLIDYFYINWRCLEKIERAETNYKKRVQKKDEELIFSGVDDLLLFKLSEFLWGCEEEPSGGTRHRLRTIRWLKMKYKEQIQKKGKYLVFSGVDGLLLFKFSKDLWGSEIVSDSENEEGEQQLVL
ncbi:hypothetical protein Q3G72_027887 [Acer saccharum]|nr:hypothetical protein Q3G72_027887 [Acer saccharum]